MNYTQYKQMTKKAGTADIVKGVSDVATGALPAITDTVSTGAAYLLALAATIGLGTGYTAAKVTAKGKLDEDTVKKEYENARLNADLNQLRGAINAEYEASNRKKSPTPARIMV